MLKALFAACTIRRIWPLVQAGTVLPRGTVRMQSGCRAALSLIKLCRENGQGMSTVSVLAMQQLLNRESQDHQIQEWWGEWHALVHPFGGPAHIPQYSHPGQLEKSSIWASGLFAWCWSLARNVRKEEETFLPVIIWHKDQAFITIQNNMIKYTISTIMRPEEKFNNHSHFHMIHLHLSLWTIKSTELEHRFLPWVFGVYKSDFLLFLSMLFQQRILCKCLIAL